MYTLKAEPQGRANSFVGTEEYLAPEIINGTGHSRCGRYSRSEGAEILIRLQGFWHVGSVSGGRICLLSLTTRSSCSSRQRSGQCIVARQSLSTCTTGTALRGLSIALMYRVVSRSSVDWWSFGILMYELVFGYTPFRGNKRDQTFENILKRVLEFPAKPEISPALQVCVLPRDCTTSQTSLSTCGHMTMCPCFCSTGPNITAVNRSAGNDSSTSLQALSMSLTKMSAFLPTGHHHEAAPEGPQGPAGDHQRGGGPQGPRLLRRHPVAAHPAPHAAVRACQVRQRGQDQHRI